MWREGTRLDLCHSPNSTCVRVRACIHPQILRQCGPRAHVSLTMGTQAGRQWGCLAGVGQRGVGAADPRTLRRGDALPSSDVAWGTLEAVCRRASSIPAASPASLPLLP